MLRFRKLLQSSAVAAMTCAATLMVAGSAGASPVVGYQPPISIEKPRVTDVQATRRQRSERRERRARRYDSRRHGKRSRSRHGRYRHRHNGWYYAIPWWLGATLTAPLLSHQYRNRSAHVAWCDNRYRSYNRRTDQFLGYDGYYHYCNSPYDNR